jgi:predicted Zn-dependent protease
MSGRQATNRRKLWTVTAGRASVLGLLLLVGGCQSMDMAAMQEASKPAMSTEIPEEAPRTIAPATPAEREHQRLVVAYGGAYENERLQRYLDDLVERLAAASERPDLPYKVTVLNVPTVNAFALPSGRIYVTRGLLALANDNAEVAAVLAHEMAHVSSRHAYARADAEKQQALVSRVMTQVVRDPTAGEIGMARSRMALASFSRQQELEADAIGVRTIARAGFDPYGASRFLASMDRQFDLRPATASVDSPVRAYDFVETHPSTPERIDRAVAIARQYVAPGAGERDRNTLLSAIDGMTYGDDPGQGFLRGRSFIHPRLGFTFVAPDGFSLDNTPKAILGIDNAGRALRLDTVKPKAGQALADYLASGWIEGVETGSVESIDLNGLPAVTALARGPEWNFRLYAIRFDQDIYRLIFAAKNLDPATDAMFKATAATFRQLSQAEIEGARPMRISVVPVRTGDTPAILATRMMYPDRQLERFLVLNGLSPGTALLPGDRVKIVTE